MKVLVAGDYSPRERVAHILRSDKALGLFSSVKDTIASVDYAIVNFETTVVDGDVLPIDKCGPNLMCRPEAVTVLRKAGFRCLTLANNHFRDYGNEGVQVSLRCFERNGLDYVGGGKDITEAEDVLYKQFEEGTLAIINVCENEFSIASTSRAGSAPLDTIKMYHRIVNARKKSDYILVIVHGGHEHYQLPSPRMKSLYRFFIEIGADAVVNHHQHCFSGYEFFKGKPIIYGLGNFLFDHSKKRNSIWNEGYLAILDFSACGIQFDAIPYIQCDNEPGIQLLHNNERMKFLEKIEQLNSIIADDTRLSEEMSKYVISRKTSIISVFSPYMSRYMRAAASRHLIPYFLPKNKVLDMIDYISCESQRDITIGYLKEFSKTE